MVPSEMAISLGFEVLNMDVPSIEIPPSPYMGARFQDSCRLGLQCFGMFIPT